MKTFRVGLVVCFVAMVFSRVDTSLFLRGQESSTKPAGASLPGLASSGSTASADRETAATAMHALQEGIKAYRAENFRAAALSFETAAATPNTATPTAHANAWLARTYLHLHRIPEAEAAARKATDVDKEQANAQTAMAEVYFREGNLVEAERILSGLVKNQNTTPRAYLGLANIYWATGNYKSARVLIEVARKNDPKDPDIEESWMRSMTPKERVEE
jgi:Flp pilus assembly protein TadD